MHLHWEDITNRSMQDISCVAEFAFPRHLCLREVLLKRWVWRELLCFLGLLKVLMSTVQPLRIGPYESAGSWLLLPEKILFLWQSLPVVGPTLILILKNPQAPLSPYSLTPQSQTDNFVSMGFANYIIAATICATILNSIINYLWGSIVLISILGSVFYCSFWR